MYETLEKLRDNLATIKGVVSCKIGVERNISPADYPLIRIVPRRITPGRPYNQRTAETLIYFGMNISQSEGLENVYEALFDLEQAIIEVVRKFGGVYQETITDEDRLDTYKLSTIRCNITAERTL
jgi:hypothetical protein